MQVEIPDKAFTNFKHTVVELGFATSHTKKVIRYDLKGLLGIRGLPALATQLLGLKLRTAGWSGSGDVVDQLIDNHWHDALAMTETQLRDWLGGVAHEAPPLLGADFFAGEHEGDESKPFVFRPGHNARKTGTVDVLASPAAKK